MLQKSREETPTGKSGPRVVHLTPAQQAVATVIAGGVFVASIVWGIKSQQANIFCFSLFFLLAFVVLLGSTLTLFANRRLLRVMKTPPAGDVPSATVAAAPVAPAGAAEALPFEARAGPPPPAFGVRVFDAHSAIGLSQAEAVRAERANGNATQAVRVWRLGIGFLVGSCVVLTVLALAAGNFVLPVLTLFIGLAIFPVVKFVRRIGDFSGTGWTASYYFWMTANKVLFPAAGLLALGYIGVALMMAIGGQHNVSVNLGQSARLVWPPAVVTWGNRLLIAAAMLAPAIYLVRLRRMGRALRRSVLADRPLKLLYLWVFAPISTKNLAVSVLSPAWHFTGAVQQLRGSDYLADVRWTVPILTGRADRYVLETPQEVAAALRSLKTEPNWLGMYRINTLLCGDGVWQLALEALLADTGAVLMNLCSFTRERRGCTYVLGQLVDHLPTRRWLLLVDESTDMDYLQQVLAEAWASMAPGSSNRGTDVAPVQVFRLSEGQGIERGIRAGLQPGTEAAIDVQANKMFEILCRGAGAG